MEAGRALGLPSRGIEVNPPDLILLVRECWCCRAGCAGGGAKVTLAFKSETNFESETLGGAGLVGDFFTGEFNT
ncbi:hypothetical protein WICPIJ_005903 [Wickerhamomyces pijperi]|uniref:Uncharacterized protein n=1 Tax=Wickerhamomyces pijperi TaxID=599730 RepID=A0A9P8TLI4_WICPI|nr:hypothetical protein WICPIJ_005903 [Wickerhamomyces pijperi]